jgi:hypothetical protein
MQTAGSPAPKPRKSFYILAALGIALLAVIGAIIFLFFQSRAVDRHFEIGNRRYERAFTKLEKAIDRYGSLKTTEDPKQTARVVAQISRESAAARAELRLAGAAFKSMRRASFVAWEKRSAGLAQEAAVRAEKGVREFEGNVERVARLLERMADISRASDKFNEAFSKTNEAITHSNGDRFEEAGVEAQAAKRLFGETKALFREIGDEPFDGRLEPLLAVIDKGRAWAEIVEKMADAGAAGELERYNKLVDKSNRLTEEIAAEARSLVLADPENWMAAGFEELNQRVLYYFEQADNRREKALDLWRQNT